MWNEKKEGRQEVVGYAVGLLALKSQVLVEDVCILQRMRKGNAGENTSRGEVVIERRGCAPSCSRETQGRIGGRQGDDMK